MEQEISKSGVWRDANGKIVTKQPETGEQLVAPGGPVSPRIARELEEAGATIETATLETPTGPTGALRTDETPTTKSTTRRARS